MEERFFYAVYTTVAALMFWSLAATLYEEMKTRQKLWMTALVAGLIFVNAFFEISSEGVGIIVELVYTCLIIRDRFRDKLTNLLSAMLLIAVLTDMTRIFILLFLDFEDAITRLVCIAIVTMILVVGFSTHFIPRLLLVLKGMVFGKKLICLLTMLGAMLVVSFGIVMLDETGKGNWVKAFLGLTLLLLIMLVILVSTLLAEVFEHKSSERENKIKETIIHEQKTLYELLVEKNNDLRRFRHDIDGRLGTLRLLLEEGEYDKAGEYLGDIVKANTALAFRQDYYGDTILDTILSMMCWRAKEKGIQINVEGQLQTDSIHIYAVAGIFANAVSNAIEACDALHSEGPVEIKAACVPAIQVVEFVNPATEQMYRNILNHVSSKEDKEAHGIGVRSLGESVKEIGGTCEYLFEEEHLVLKITWETKKL